MNEKILKNDIETLKHIEKVRDGLFSVILELDRRIQEHDRSKLESPEREIFGEYSDLLSKTKYGTPEYDELLEKVKPAIEHHYSRNRHHPEFHKNGINDMNLVDLIELLVDWKCSSERTLNGNIRFSIEKNAERFGISEQLTGIFINTIKEVL